MISLTRLSGSAFVLNSDLIERVDKTPDTVVTLVDGKKYLVAESLAEVLERVRAHRAEIIAMSTGMAEQAAAQPAPGGRPQRLAAVTPHPATLEGNDT